MVDNTLFDNWSRRSEDTRAFRFLIVCLTGSEWIIIVAHVRKRHRIVEGGAGRHITSSFASSERTQLVTELNLNFC